MRYQKISNQWILDIIIPYCTLIYILLLEIERKNIRIIKNIFKINKIIIYIQNIFKACLIVIQESVSNIFNT